MRILIAEDERVARCALEAMPRDWGYEVVVACDGAEAWDLLERGDSPAIALLDRIMPGLDGVEICRNTIGSTVSSSRRDTSH